MHQFTTPSLSKTIWVRWVGRQFPSPPQSPDLVPCDFWLFHKLTSCRYETIEMKEVVTKVIDTITQEDFHGVFQKLLEWVQVHCNRRRLLRRGLELHVCTIENSAHTKKVWNLLCAPCMYNSKTDVRFMQDAPKAVWCIPYVPVPLFPSLKQNFIAYCSS